MFMLIFVNLFLSSPLLVECLFAGESCFTEDEAGICTVLAECQPLIAEIERAGSPMPLHMRRKLQTLSCGFELDQPMVCCMSSESTATNQNWGFIDSNTDKDESPKNPNDGTNALNSNGADDKNVSNDKRINDGSPDIRGHRNLRLLPTNCGVTVGGNRISGGNRTSLFEMPWMILLSYYNGRETKLSCGGTLITERYVLTAAHCVSFLGSGLRLDSVILGEHDVRKDPDCERVEGIESCAPNILNVKVESVISHPGYKPQTLFDDIALIKLSQPADFNLDRMKPICLPTTLELQRESLVGRNGEVAGWGVTEEGIQSPVLLSVNLPIISNRDCQAAYNGLPRIYDMQMCAGGVKDKDSCGGDSGGPLMYHAVVGSGQLRSVQRGIVSYGSKRCGIGGFPGVYTNIAHYMDWILDNIDN